MTQWFSGPVETRTFCWALVGLDRVTTLTRKSDGSRGRVTLNGDSEWGGRGDKMWAVAGEDEGEGLH